MVADELAGVRLRPVVSLPADIERRADRYKKFCMSSDERIAAQYLSPSGFSFWRWSDDGEVIHWAGGGTIVFRSQLRQIVDALAPEGLPPFEALLMLLAACRSDWRGSPAHLGKFAKVLADAMFGGHDEWIYGSHDEWLKALAWKLDAVSSLPEARRSTTTARIALARAVFETVREPMTAAAAHSVANLLRGSSIKLFATNTGQAAGPDWMSDLILLSRCIDRVDLNRLEEFERTGTDLLPRPAEIDEPEFSSIRELLGSIEHDEELAGLARLARHVMAGLSLPRPLTEPEELPVGGFSDISHRGPFDRLLVSELANDDDVLMTRVALHEALYLRREAPPKSPPDSRVVVFDVGIRMWGVPRLFGTAVGLALGATVDKAAGVRFLRAEGDVLAEVPLQNREDLIEHLEVLRHETHAGAALPAVANLARATHEEAAVILVTSREATADPEFQQSLAQAGLSGLHVATVNRQGEFELTERTAFGARQLAAQRLSIDEILEPPARRSGAAASSIRLLRPEYDPELPAILSVDPFPFRLPHSIQRGRAWHIPEAGVAALTSDGRFMLWDEPGLAARQLSDGIPPGEVLHRGGDPDTLRAVVRGRKGVFLIQADVETGEVSSLWLAAKSLKVQAACEHNGRLMLIRKGEIESFDPVSGEFLQELRIPAGLKWRNGRYFTANGNLHVLSHTGLSPHFEEVFPDDFQVACTGGFDSHEHEGPVGLTVGGAFVTWDRKTILTSSDIPIAPPLRITDVSFDGDVVLLESINTYQKATVHLSAGRCTPVCDAIADSSSVQWVHQRSVRTRFRMFSISPGPRLSFWNKGSSVWEIARQTTSGVMRVQSISGGDSRRTTPFDALRPCLLPGDRRFQLRVATAPDGSRIYVDSRGLLHLRSSNIEIPELSFVILDDGELACWSSDGTRVGPHYLIGNPGTVNRNEPGRVAALHIQTQLNRFLDHCTSHGNR